MAAKAVWSMDVTKKSRDAKTGKAILSADLMDAGVLQGHLSVTITPERVMRLDWVAADGVPALTGFEAWSTT